MAFNPFASGGRGGGAPHRNQQNGNGGFNGGRGGGRQSNANLQSSVVNKNPFASNSGQMGLQNTSVQNIPSSSRGFNDNRGTQNQFQQNVQGRGNIGGRNSNYSNQNRLEQSSGAVRANVNPIAAKTSGMTVGTAGGFANNSMMETENQPSFNKFGGSQLTGQSQNLTAKVNVNPFGANAQQHMQHQSQQQTFQQPQHSRPFGSSAVSSNPFSQQEVANRGAPQQPAGFATNNNNLFGAAQQTQAQTVFNSSSGGFGGSSNNPFSKNTSNVSSFSGGNNSNFGGNSHSSDGSGVSRAPVQVSLQDVQQIDLSSMTKQTKSAMSEAIFDLDVPAMPSTTAATNNSGATKPAPTFSSSSFMNTSSVTVTPSTSSNAKLTSNVVGSAVTVSNSGTVCGGSDTEDSAFLDYYNKIMKNCPFGNDDKDLVLDSNPYNYMQKRSALNATGGSEQPLNYFTDPKYRNKAIKDKFDFILVPGRIPLQPPTAYSTQ